MFAAVPSGQHIEELLSRNLSCKLPPRNYSCQMHSRTVFLYWAFALPSCLLPVLENQAGYVQRRLTFCTEHRASPKTPRSPRTAASGPLAALGEHWLPVQLTDMGWPAPACLHRSGGVSPFVLITALTFIKRVAFQCPPEDQGQGG